MKGLEHKKHSLKWHRRYMSMAQLIATWSKHPNHKIGALAVGNFGQITSTGYNGWPRGMVDEEEGRERTNRRGRSRTIHAESNLICNAQLTGTVLMGNTIYITLFPCSGCSLLLTQVGVTDIVVPLRKTDGTLDKWHEDWEEAEAILKDTGVGVTLL